jgi:uncharacterized protein (TIGR00369 family)
MINKKAKRPPAKQDAKAARARNGGGVIARSPLLAGGMPQALGVRLVSITRKKVMAEMSIKPMHMNRNGRVNGGALMAFADVLGAAGTVANLPQGHSTATLESKTNFFAAGQGPMLTAVSIPLHVGRTTNVWQTTIRNPDQRVVAIVTQTQIVLAPRPAPAPDAVKTKR